MDNNNQLKANIQEIVNNDFYGSAKLNDKQYILSLDNINDISSLNEIINDGLSKNFEEKQNEIKEEKNNEDKKFEKISKKRDNIQIINTFEMEYKQNEKKEKIIQKSKEVPYLIIIDKKSFNLDNINNIINREELEKKINDKERKEQNIQDKKINDFKIEKFAYSINKESKEINKGYHNILLKKIPFIIEQKLLKRKSQDNIQHQIENEEIIKNE